MTLRAACEDAGCLHGVTIAGAIHADFSGGREFGGAANCVLVVPAAAVVDTGRACVVPGAGVRNAEVFRQR